MSPLHDFPKHSNVNGLCQGGKDGTVRGTVSSTREPVPKHIFTVSVPPHLADAVSELVSALVETASDPERGKLDSRIASAAWRLARERRRLARA